MNEFSQKDYYDAVEVLRKKVFNLEQWENNHFIVSPFGEIKPIVSRSFWSRQGREKIKRNLFRRLRKITKPFNFVKMITLTFENNSLFYPRCITDYLRSFFAPFRKHDIPFKYFWVAEFQERGTIHYHVLIFVKRNVHKSLKKQVWYKYFNADRVRRFWSFGRATITSPKKRFKNENKDYFMNAYQSAKVYALKYIIKQYKEISFGDDEGFSCEDYIIKNKHLLHILLFRKHFGMFRLYGMSIIRVWNKTGFGIKKKDYKSFCHRLFQYAVLSSWDLYKDGLRLYIAKVRSGVWDRSLENLSNAFLIVLSFYSSKIYNIKQEAILGTKRLNRKITINGNNIFSKICWKLEKVA